MTAQARGPLLSTCRPQWSSGLLAQPGPARSQILYFRGENRQTDLPISAFQIKEKKKKTKKHFSNLPCVPHVANSTFHKQQVYFFLSCPHSCVLPGAAPAGTRRTTRKRHTPSSGAGRRQLRSAPPLRRDTEHFLEGPVNCSHEGAPTQLETPAGGLWQVHGSPQRHWL